MKTIFLLLNALTTGCIAHFQPQSILSRFLDGIPTDILQGSITSKSGPTIAPQFTASVNTSVSDPSLPFGAASGIFVYDATVEKYWMELISSIPKFGPEAKINQTTLGYGNSSTGGTYQVSDGQCTHFTGAYSQGGFEGLFGWLTYANKTGEDSVDGKVCDVFSFTPPPPYDKYGSLSACIHQDEVVYLNRMHQKMFFTNFHRSTDQSKFQTPPSCAAEFKTCGSGEIVQKMVYVAHPLNNYNISGQDVADAKGDAVFLCTDRLMWSIGNYKLISVFELSIVDTFSQYTNYPPPGNRGFGGDGFHVGRETPIGIGRHGGQCDDDADLWESLGIWYSLPAGGQCRDEEQKLGDECTWRIDRRVDTIEMGCLFHERGMLAMCNKTTAPFDDVTKVLVNALASEDISKGGCTSITQPMCKEHPACAHLEGDCCPHEDGTYLDCCNMRVNSHAALVV